MKEPSNTYTVAKYQHFSISHSQANPDYSSGLLTIIFRVLKTTVYSSARHWNMEQLCREISISFHFSSSCILIWKKSDFKQLGGQFQIKQ